MGNDDEGQYFPKYKCYDLRALEKFAFCIFSLENFNILHLYLTIFVIGGMHLGQTISKVKVNLAKRGQVVHENDVQVYTSL